jgi:hypothetical protein
MPRGSAGPCWNQLEPAGLLRAAAEHRPAGFHPLALPDGALQSPAFAAPYDLLTTLDAPLRRALRAWPLFGLWGRLLCWRTAFVGSTVSEYLLLPRPVQATDVQALPRRWAAAWGHSHALLVAKDIPQRSPLLSEHENALADALAAACADAGYLLLEGQALAYVPIDFDSIDTYLQRLSSSRRKNLRRKLRSRDKLLVRALPTGSACFDDDTVVDACYALYLAVHAQSELHFDLLSRAFFAAVLRDAGSGGIVFEYRLRDEAATLVGWNLCFESRGMLVDKYIGLRYPAAREHDLYFVSWFVNLQHALDRGLTHYVAGWTDPEVKAQLGASFTFTRHAVFVRNPLLRRLGRRMAHLFEGDAQALAARPAAPASQA